MKPEEKVLKLGLSTGTSQNDEGHLSKKQREKVINFFSSMSYVFYMFKHWCGMTHRSYSRPPKKKH